MPLLVIQSPATYSHAQHSTVPSPLPWKKLAEKTNADVVIKHWDETQLCELPVPSQLTPFYNKIPSKYIKYMTTTSVLVSSS